MNYHQGDVLLVRIDKLPVGAKKIREEIVQFGEITGHAHKIIGSGIYEENGKWYVEVPKSEPMTHEDHPFTPPIEAGVYARRIQQEYFPDGFRDTKD